MKYIDLRSDTVTQPTDDMRRAMAAAEVGDDVYGDDPTVNRLESVAARIFKKEAALFVTSGTLGNQLGIMSQTRRGDEIITGDISHIVAHEVAAAAVLSGVMCRMLPFKNAVPDVDMIETAIRPVDIHEPPTTLICLENALANGRVVPLERMRDIFNMAHRHNIPVHLDGARMFNAAAALNVDVSEVAACCDTLSCCVSKGLCAPVGAVFAGPRTVVEKARKYRKMLGGGMRQAGILAAAALIALEDMPKRLYIDHENAAYMAKRLSEIPGVAVNLDDVHINMVFFTTNLSPEKNAMVQEQMLQKGIKTGGYENAMHRWVTNNDVSRENINTAIDALADVLAGLRGQANN